MLFLGQARYSYFFLISNLQVFLYYSNKLVICDDGDREGTFGIFHLLI